MSIIQRINDADLPKGWTHEATDWQVATDPDFKNILVESLNDSDNLTTIAHNTKTEVGETYYGRSRMLLNTGFTEWSDIGIFTPKDIDDVVSNMDIPSIITAPTVTTKYDSDSHPSSGFYIEASKFATLGTASHMSTDWVIESSKGKAVWASLGNKHDLNSILIDKILPVNEVYHAHASFKGSNFDISQYGTTTFYVSNDELLVLNTKLVGINSNVNLVLDIPEIPGLNILEWKLLKEGETVNSGYRTDTFLTIDKDDLEPGVDYILAIKLKVNSKEGEWSYSYFTPLDVAIELPTSNNVPYNGNGKADFFPISFPLKFVNYEK